MNLVDAHAHIGDFPGFVSGGDRTAEMLIQAWTPLAWTVD